MATVVEREPGCNVCHHRDCSQAPASFRSGDILQVVDARGLRDNDVELADVFSSGRVSYLKLTQDVSPTGTIIAAIYLDRALRHVDADGDRCDCTDGSACMTQDDLEYYVSSSFFKRADNICPTTLHVPVSNHYYVDPTACAEKDTCMSTYRKQLTPSQKKNLSTDAAALVEAGYLNSDLTLASNNHFIAFLAGMFEKEYAAEARRELAEDDKRRKESEE